MGGQTVTAERIAAAERTLEVWANTCDLEALAAAEEILSDLGLCVVQDGRRLLIEPDTDD